MAVPALQAAGAVLGIRSMLPRALTLAALGLLLLLTVIVAPLALLSSAGGAATDGVPGIPSAFVPIYHESAAAFGVDWLVLASVHQEETAFSTHATTYRGLNFAGCCAGPFQFNVTNGPPSTWDTHKWAFRRGRRPGAYPHRQAPHPSVYDDFDAGMAAGSLLRANGADATLGTRTFNAVRAYNGVGPIAEAYARRVLDRARVWQAETGPVPDGGAPPGSPPGEELSWPVTGPVVSPFGMRWGRLHAGIDIAAPSGTPILAAATGRVTTRGPVSGYGLMTCLEHVPPYSTCYAHQSRFAPTPTGGVVPRGALVGYVGCTGHCFGPHLHFEVRISGQAVDPLPYLNGRG